MVKKTVVISIPFCVVVDLPDEVRLPMDLKDEEREKILGLANEKIKSSPEILGNPEIVRITDARPESPYTGKQDEDFAIPEIKRVIGTLVDLGKTLDSTLQKAIEKAKEKASAGDKK